jgi:hypothetical protein
MSITLKSQIHGSSYGSPTTDNACGFSMLWNQIQGEHTLILRTDIKTLSYLSNSWGYLKPFYSNTISIQTLQHHGSVLPISTTTVDFTNFLTT